MKIIQSEGGPLICICADQREHWMGSSGKGFADHHPDSSTDYEAAISSEKDENGLPSLVGLVKASRSGAIVLAMPFETAIVEHGPDFVHIAQVDYGEPDWSYDALSSLDFERLPHGPRDTLRFRCEGCTYTLFDAAYAGQEIGDDYLSFSLEGGEYVVSGGAYEPDGSTGLILYRIRKG